MHQSSGTSLQINLSVLWGLLNALAGGGDSWLQRHSGGSLNDSGMGDGRHCRDANPISALTMSKRAWMVGKRHQKERVADSLLEGCSQSTAFSTLECVRRVRENKTSGTTNVAIPSPAGLYLMLAALLAGGAEIRDPSGATLAEVQAQRQASQRPRFLKSGAEICLSERRAWWWHSRRGDELDYWTGTGQDRAHPGST